MDRLFRGSVINPDTFFLEGHLSLYTWESKSGSDLQFLEFTKDDLDELCE